MRPRTQLVLAVLAVIAGCGGGETTTTVVQDPGEGEAVVPDLSGERLDVAEHDLDELGLRYEEIGGGAFGIIDRANWEVCETDPGSGESVIEGERVELVVDRPGAC